ncbi:hypothetical protein MMC11_004134 [Xylographa trunciseda]|nr:hypothetical protein [Xylographa trunciseda]
MASQVKKRPRVSKVLRPSRSAAKELSLSQGPHPPIGELKLHPDAEKTLRLIRDKYGEPVSILPVDAEELFCICLSVEGRYAGGMVECTNASKCLARWFHLSCIGMIVPPKEEDDWFCTRCIQHRIGRAGDWFDRLLYNSRRQLQNTILGQPCSTSVHLSKAKSNNPSTYRPENTPSWRILHGNIPAAADLATTMREPLRSLCPPPNGFPDFEDDVVMCDAVDSPCDTTLSQETEVLEDSRIFRRHMSYVHRPESRTDRTPVVRRETSSTKDHTKSDVHITGHAMDRTDSGSVSETEYANEYGAYTDVSEFYEDVSDGYLGEESDVSMSGDS